MKQVAQVNQKQNQTNTEVQLKQKLKQAKQHFHKNEQQESLKIYNQIINANTNTQSSQILQAYRNRASLLLVKKQYTNAVADCQKYLSLIKTAVSPQIYVLYITALIKNNEIQKAKQISKSANQQFPYHKKLQQISKLTKQKQIANDDDLYVQQMFQKLCCHPKVREYMKDQSFLTKVERLIRNPSLANALSKIDPRIKQAADALMMADEQWQ